jgi:hypothetical protein
VFIVAIEGITMLALYVVSALVLAGVPMHREFARTGELTIRAGARVVVHAACVTLLALVLHWFAWQRLGLNWVSEWRGVEFQILRHAVLCAACVLVVYVTVAGGIALLRTAGRSWRAA